MNTDKPLKGIKVVELSTAVAAPSCGRILAYLGADVIKIEGIAGDSYRRVYTPYLPSEKGDSPIFDMLNSQKKFISVNLKNKDVIKYVLKLIEDCDVFFSNVRNAGLNRLGLDYESVKAINPRIIYGHFSGYGETGPLCELPGYDSTAYLTRNGLYRNFVSEDAPPMVHCPGLGDLNCGLALSASIMGALLQRVRTGEGQKVTASLAQVGAWNMLMPVSYAQIDYKLCSADGAPVCIMDASFKCKDGNWVLYSATTDKQWDGFLRALELEELIGDPRYATPTLREINTREMLPAATAAFLKYTADEMVDRFRANDVPCERHRKTIEITTDEQLWATNTLYKTAYSDREYVLINPPFYYADKDLSYHGRAVKHGENTKEILTSVGCSEEEFNALLASGDVYLS